MEPFPFARLALLDSHVHFVHPERMDEILSLMDAVPCPRFNLVCIPNRDGSTHNPAARYFKEHYPERVYISGALQYGELPASASPARVSAALAKQVRALKAGGFDGLKLIEGKPEVRKLLPYPLDGARYAGLWAALEEEQFPVVFHVTDPDEFWDGAACPDWAHQSGCDYSDGSYPAKEEFYGEVERILARHPGLKISFAHFYFMANDLARAARFLEAHPGACFDLAPHIGMYHDFSRQPAAARDFFLRFQDRILYGTDTDTRVLTRGPAVRSQMGALPLLIRSFLEHSGPVSLPGLPALQGIGLA